MWKILAVVLSGFVLLCGFVAFVFYCADGFVIANAQFTVSVMLAYFIDTMIIFLVIAAMFVFILAVGSLVASIVDHIQGDK